MSVSNETLRKTLLKYCQDETAGTRLEVGPDEWDITDGPNSCSCSYEPTGFFGEIFLLKDIVKHLSYPKNFYSFRHYHNYKKLVICHQVRNSIVFSISVLSHHLHHSEQVATRNGITK